MSQQHVYSFNYLKLKYHLKEIFNYLEVLSNFTDKPLEWELPDQKLSTLLVFTDFTAYPIKSIQLVT